MDMNLLESDLNNYSLRSFNLINNIWKKDSDQNNSNLSNNNSPNNKKRKSQPVIENKNSGNKKFKSDREIINLLMNNKIDPPKDNNETENSGCNNPLCDHLDYNENELEEIKNRPLEIPNEIKNIDDLIELGKKYHCKKNRIYYGLNLRLLCNLVEPLTKLKNMIGMKSVKENMVNQIIFFLQGFNQKEKCNECLDCIYGLTCLLNMNNDMLHTVITGPPGVGKTELGKILGQVYKAMGVLSHGKMNIATRGDLIGKYLGHSFLKTQEFIDKCRGGVMFIDEAYSLGNEEKRDSFAKECIDCINLNLSEKKDFLCIIAGYPDELDKCFFAYNAGLKRRFTFRYDIQEYTSDELMEIFLLKVKSCGWFTEIDLNENDSVQTIRTKEENRIKIKQFFKDNMQYFPNFGGDIETLLLNCKIIHGRRVLFEEKIVKKIFTLHDIKNGLEQFVKHRKYKEKEVMSESLRRMYT